MSNLNSYIRLWAVIKNQNLDKENKTIQPWIDKLELEQRG